METNLIFSFKTDISSNSIPEELNNPFGSFIPEIARIAAQEFQEFISKTASEWEHDFRVQKGKMFGVLVVQKTDSSYGYLGTVSGKLHGSTTCSHFAPSVFDHSVDDFFINRGMTELTQMGTLIENSYELDKIIALKEQRRQKSLAVQQQLFENYQFVNSLGMEKNILEIFKHSSHDQPPSGAGECAAPKLLNYAYKEQLIPIALAEFWWGNAPKNKEREHKSFYPACKNKCRPILEYMLDNTALFEQAWLSQKPVS